VAFQLLHKKTLVSISATGLIIVPLKSLGQQLADDSSRQGFRAVSVTAEVLGDSPRLLEVGPFIGSGPMLTSVP